jgi:2'-hydroxyisoflavone reductase
MAEREAEGGAGRTRRGLLVDAAAVGVAAAFVAASGRRAAASPEETASAPAPRAAKPLKILMLGGTGFVGPETVAPAVARGHAVTLFNRGRTNPGLFPGLEKLRGDRNGDVSALKGRSFDAVIDTSGYVPAHVRRVAEALGDRVGHYVFVSTISVYPAVGQSKETVTEDSPVGTIEDETTERVTGETYGPLKVLSERAAEKAWPGRVAHVRPGLIVGPGDPTDRFTYWPARVARGGEILAPGDGSTEVQFVDVRDLGEWLVRVAEESTSGVYNALGFRGRLSFEEMLHGAKCAIRTDCSFTWVAEEFLEAEKVGPWQDLPLWVPSASSGHVSNDRAVAKGLSFRPVARTISDTLDWVVATKRDVPFGTKRRSGLSPEREASLLAAWRARAGAR